ncbi:TPA: hypothetical protein G8C30_004913 [Salmonella enterica]|uniref:Uncharacterized protein n=1 Tax=Salmonella enterica TaxID=28901 RepID=A0A746ELR6_SALER|nr:hypothetical protein [Salmonella enterica]
MCLSFGCTSVFSPSFEGFFFHFLLMDAVAVMRYVKSDILSKELHTRFHKEEVYRVALTLLGRFFSLF